MTTKAIWIEWRKPITKTEKKEYGNTQLQNCSTAKVFINTDKIGKNSEEEVKTFWHEMTHVFLQFHRKKALKKDHEEDLCRTVEIILWEIFRHV